MSQNLHNKVNIESNFEIKEISLPGLGSLEMKIINPSSARF